MVSKEASKCIVTNSESDSEAAPSLSLEMKYSLDASRQVRKRNKALQVRFKDICEAQNEQREAAVQAAGKGGRTASCRAPYRKYMTVPARRSIPNVTRSTGVQTSPDLRKRYQTFPFERKKGHTFKHAATVESFKGHSNGLAAARKVPEATVGSGEAMQSVGRGVYRTQALLHTNNCAVATEPFSTTDCPDGPTSPDSEVSCPEDKQYLPNVLDSSTNAEFHIYGPETGHQKGLHRGEGDPYPSAKRQLLNFDEAPGAPRKDPAAGVTGPIAWNSLTQVECLESPSAQGKRKKGSQLNGLQMQSQAVPPAACHATQLRCHAATFASHALQGAEAARALSRAATGAPEPCHQIVPVAQDGDLKAQLQVMENLISSSQETIKVLLGVIQELEKGEAHREGLSYRTGQDTTNCDTCRNSACIIYSVELDFKQQEDKLQPLMKRLCPMEDAQLPSLPYPHEAFTSTPKRKSKTESKKHARWKLWFL
ncbi:inhibitory synaptic factor 2A-like [Brienomyrus brachyistius]|uniref:inhibitory synaptic factor 2A-like n=1 Tax=Brienomyrus brachyistius TaxID=42636 RepID=UPI0020B3C5AD|nr:inhibitory synaptic factor 2A-like [Brienomyrus brachyistius]